MGRALRPSVPADRPADARASVGKHHAALDAAGASLVSALVRALAIAGGSPPPKRLSHRDSVLHSPIASAPGHREIACQPRHHMRNRATGIR